jgi:HEAT repeat protein
MAAITMDWRPFLTGWSAELMTTDLARHACPPPESRDWLGFESAADSDITDLEVRLGLILPPSYKSFLQITNGWRVTTPFIYRVRPAAEVNWFHIENENWVEGYTRNTPEVPTEYNYSYMCRYTEDGAGDYHPGHMNTLVQISDVENGVYLLNPQAVTPDGEWEAWFLANWTAGPLRFSSFAHLMVREFKTFRELMKITGPEPSKLAIPGPNIRRVSVVKAPSKIPETESIETLISQIESDDPSVRSKAIRAFWGKLKGRFQESKRRPDLVAPLTDLFYRSRDAEIRAACVAGLTEFAEDLLAPKPLLDALSDSDPSVVMHGVFALAYFPDARGVESLCRFIESNVDVSFKESAMGQLGKIGDPRAIPALVKVLLQAENQDLQTFTTAGYNLGRCGPKGVDVLIDAINHTDPRIRLAAVIGLDISNDPRASVYLDRMKNDPAATVRQRASSQTRKP